MARALKQKVVVGPGGVIEIRSPELPDGVHPDVIVLYEEKNEDHAPLSELIGKTKGSFNTVEEVDKFIREGRCG